MRHIHLFLASVLASAAIVAGACTLNPQPLPPASPDASTNADAGDRGSLQNAEDGAAATPTAGDGDGGGNDGVKTDEGGSDASTDGDTDAEVSDAADQ